MTKEERVKKLGEIKDAILKNKINKVKALAKKGAARYVDSKSGWTPLHYAAAVGTGAKLVPILVKSGAAINRKSKDGNTPLHWAAHKRHCTMIEALVVVKGIDIDARDSKGATPLHSAVLTNCLSTVEALLKAGASPNVENNEGHCPLDRVMSSSIEDVLKEHGAEYSEKTKIRKRQEQFSHWDRTTFTMLVGVIATGKKAQGDTAPTEEILVKSMDEAEGLLKDYRKQEDKIFGEGHGPWFWSGGRPGMF